MKIICVGRNYAAHARELNNDLPTEPVLFLKPETALLPKHHPFVIPDITDDLHYECELVLRIDKLGKNIAPKFAHRYYSEVGLGIDFTARDLQNELKSKGLPWEKAKAFDFSAPIGNTFIPISNFPSLESINFALKKNGEWVQQGNTRDMIFGFDDLIAEISRYFTLKKGDLIFTGTPSGVGKVQPGDVLEGFIEEELILSLKIN